jgi:FkbM family methyltransferase
MEAQSEPFGTYRPSRAQRMVLGLTRVPPFYRGSFRPTWVRLLNRLRAGPVDVSTCYGRFRVYPTTNLVDSALMLHPAYNREEIDFLKEGTAEGGTFVDVGANIGLYTVALAQHLRGTGTVVAVEPNPVCVGRLQTNVALNAFPQVRVFPVGVADFTGRARLVILENDLAIAHIVRDDERGDFEVRTLLDILDDAGVHEVSALKIDVEGFEFAALGPFFASTPRTRWPRRLCSEHLLDSGEVLEVLRKCGYRLVKDTRNNSLFVLEGS